MKKKWCKHCEVYFDEDTYIKHMRLAHQEVVFEEKEVKKENYWMCPIHKKAIKFPNCEECGGTVIIIRRNVYNTWLKFMRYYNDHVHEWIKSKFSNEWYNCHCLFCNNKPELVGIHQRPDGKLMDYQGKVITIDCN